VASTELLVGWVSGKGSLTLLMASYCWLVISHELCVDRVPGEGEVITIVAADLKQQVAGTVLLVGWVPREENLMMFMVIDCWQQAELCAIWVPGEKDMVMLMVTDCRQLVITVLCVSWAPGEGEVMMFVAANSSF